MDPHFDGVIFKTYTAELRRRLRYPYPPFLVLDVRPRNEYERGHIPGAVPVDPPGLTAFPAGADGRTEIFIVGGVPEDPRMREASLALHRLGAHRVVELTGGMFEWKRDGGPIEGKTAA